MEDKAKVLKDLNYLGSITEHVRQINGGEIKEKDEDEMKNNLDTVTRLLNVYCGDPIKDGETDVYPFNYPLTAEVLNDYYKKRMGVDHPMYRKHQLRQIHEYIKKSERNQTKKIYGKDYDIMVKIAERILREGYIQKERDIER